MQPAVRCITGAGVLSRPGEVLRWTGIAPEHIVIEADKNHSRIAAILHARSQALRGEIRATLLRIDADRYALLAQQVHDTKDESLASTLTGIGLAEIERDAVELADIDLALQRIAAGTYGQCMACGATISDQRLEAYPSAKRCLPCQQKKEQPQTG